MRDLAYAAAIAMLACACSSESETGAPAGSPGGACAPEVLAESSAATRYYVAQNQPGADNDACDGLAATDEGNGHCPWKDFTSDVTRRALEQQKSVRLDVREGTYLVEGWEGIQVSGTGTSEAERVVLSSYPGEAAVLDVARPDGVGCDAASAPDDPKCVREVVRVAGAFTLVQGLTIRNGLGYHLEVTGGTDALIRCNHFVETVPFSMRSDQMKLDAGATRVVIRNNEFEQFRSQAIDMAPAFDVTIEENEFHHPVEGDSGIVGMKLGTSGVRIVNNDIHDLGQEWLNNHAFSLGGTGTALPEPGEWLASDLHVIGNHVENTKGILAQFVSCRDCSVEDNELVNAGAGIFVSASALGDAQCSGGCEPSQNPRITGNRMRDLMGNGDAGTADSFVLVEAGEGQGLIAGKNLYCASVVADASFGWNGTKVGFEEWKTSSATDADSEVVLFSDARCSGW